LISKRRDSGINFRYTRPQNIINLYKGLKSS